MKPVKLEVDVEKARELLPRVLWSNVNHRVVQCFDRFVDDYSVVLVAEIGTHDSMGDTRWVEVVNASDANRIFRHAIESTIGQLPYRTKKEKNDE